MYCLLTDGGCPTDPKTCIYVQSISVSLQKVIYHITT